MTSSLLDQILFDFVRQGAGRNRFLDFVGVAVAEYLPYALLVALVVFLVREKDWQRRAYSLLLIFAAALVARGFFTELLRFIAPRPRPFVALGFEPLIARSATPSFPSGHAAVFFALAAALWFLNRRWAAWFFGCGILIGIGRVFVGVHWPSDILAGAIVGLGSGLLAWYVLPRPVSPSPSGER